MTALKRSSGGGRLIPRFARATLISYLELEADPRIPAHGLTPFKTLIPQFHIMAGLGKFLKQAQKMQQKVEATQAEIEAMELDVASGGGAVKIKINGAGKFLSLEVDPELLKEEASLVNDTLLAAVQDAAQQAKAYNDEKMKSATAGFQMPGMM